MNLKLFKLMVLILKYVVILEAFCMLVHASLTLANINYPIAEYLFAHSVAGFILMIIQSYLLKFCNLYRGFLCYNFLVYSCIMYNRCFGFDDYVIQVRIGLVTIGLILFFILFKQLKQFFSCEVTNK